MSKSNGRYSRLSDNDNNDNDNDNDDNNNTRYHTASRPPPYTSVQELSSLPFNPAAAAAAAATNLNSATPLIPLPFSTSQYSSTLSPSPPNGSRPLELLAGTGPCSDFSQPHGYPRYPHHPPPLHQLQLYSDNTGSAAVVGSSSFAQVPLNPYQQPYVHYQPLYSHQPPFPPPPSSSQSTSTTTTTIPTSSVNGTSPAQPIRHEAMDSTPLILVRPPSRIEDLKARPGVVICQHCRHLVITETFPENGSCTYLGILALLLAGVSSCGCCLIPLCITSCKDILHSCPNCQEDIGLYSRIKDRSFPVAIRRS